MSSVKIYTAVSEDLSPLIQGEGLCVDMVRYSDYAALEAKCSALAADNSALSKFIDDECYVYGPHDVEPVDAVLEKPETPATDAFLSEVRASGVEMFAASLKVVGGGEHPYSAVANEFADQLRKGVQS